MLRLRFIIIGTRIRKYFNQIYKSLCTAPKCQRSSSQSSKFSFPAMITPTSLSSTTRCFTLLPRLIWPSTQSRSYYTRLHHLRPRRALMYVPGSDDRKLAKIPQLGADCVCLDCEDGVAVGKKEEARQGIRRLLDEANVDFGKSECSVRVNCIESGMCEEDLRTVLGGINLPDALHLPKVLIAV